jgi:anti-anti-sigma factor
VDEQVGLVVSTSRARTTRVRRHLRLDCDVRGTTAEVAVDGELDMAGAFKLEPAIEKVVAENRLDELFFDLAGVSFMDSAGLGSLLSTQERLKDLGIDAKVRRPSRAVERVLDVSGTRSVLLD